jgi:alkanesulfonate monooxygenase SsuD/methylene tetrahydromethanopterin reductase-like flavin-dependent oxidoreductase (luciferase family)
MKFGIFDHVDASGASLSDYYEERLRLVELYDAAGFHAYHIAEHHSTPLGMAASPSVFLAAVAQRTKNLRFGPMIFALPLYHPLRLFEEICMLDHMSRGRLELGFGRGASPLELKIFGVEPTEAQEFYDESMRIIMEGFKGGRINVTGKFFDCGDVPVIFDSKQKPHPPLWYGVHSTDSARRAAKSGLNIISLDPGSPTGEFVDAFTEALEQGTATPLMGIGRFVTVAPSDSEALDIARRSYPVWHDSFNYLFRDRGSSPRHQRADTYDGLAADGMGIAGSPETVIDFLKEDLKVSKANYLVCQFAFGDQTETEMRQTVELFSDAVMPKLSGL